MGVYASDRIGTFASVFEDISFREKSRIFVENHSKSWISHMDLGGGPSIRGSGLDELLGRPGRTRERSRRATEPPAAPSGSGAARGTTRDRGDSLDTDLGCSHLPT